MLTDDRFRHLCTFVRQYLEETAARVLERETGRKPGEYNYLPPEASA